MLRERLVLTKSPDAEVGVTASRPIRGPRVLEEVLMRIGILASAFLVVLLAFSAEAQVPAAINPTISNVKTQRDTQGISVAQLGAATIDKPPAAALGPGSGWYFDLSGQGSYLSGRKNFVFGTEQ